MKSEPLARFRLYPEKRSCLHATAIVWPTRAAMIKHLSREGIPRPGSIAAICRSIDVFQVRPGKPTRKLPIFAEVHFYRSCMGGGLVAHELMHATFSWARRVGLAGAALTGSSDDPDVAPEEERCCEVHGRMVASFVNRAHAAGFYR